MTVIDLKSHAHTQTINAGTEHPKAVESRRLAAVRRLEAAKIKAAIATEGIHFFQKGLYTFCYRREGRNIIEVATSIRHPGDKHDPHIGKREALNYFMSGARTQFRVPKHEHAREMLENMYHHALS